MADLFRKMDERRADQNFDIYVTFLEIYNEEIRDLLAEPGHGAPRGGLQIREDKSVRVVGLTELHPSSAEHIKEIVLLGNTRRTQSPTHANETSSRSHAVLQVHVTQSPRTASTTEEKTAATLSIIDLAGSERAAATTNMGQRMVEGANINKSLLALGNCINALCESGGGTRHVPYRNSKLTRLLKFSLGGNCKTVMIVCIAPTSNHFDDTHNTLLYADRASKIKTKVVTRNVVNVDRHVGQYVEAINRLNLEVAELKARLAGKLSNDADIQRRRREDAKAEIERARTDMGRKADQTLSTILDGARTRVTLDLANAAIQACMVREKELGAIESQHGVLTNDLVAERALLASLCSSHESALQSGSQSSTSVQRSLNAESMLDATIHAVTERRTDKLDDVAIEAIKIEAKFRKETIERLKAEAYCEALKSAFVGQAQLVTNLLGTLARCTSVIEGTSAALSQSPEDGASSSTSMSEIAFSLHQLAQNTSDSVQTLVNGSFNLVSTMPPPPSEVPSIVVQTYTSSTLAAPHRPSFPMPSPRKPFRSSPRKTRVSMTPMTLRSTSRRLSLKPPERKKAVHWKDQEGQEGDPKELVSVMNDVSMVRPPSTCGSESEWEDDRTDDSMSISFASTSTTSVKDGPPVRNAIRRSRASRLDPSFLKSRPTTLTSLVESEEPAPIASVSANDSRRDSPLTDRANFSEISVMQDGSKGSASTSFSASPRPKEKRKRSNVGPLRHERQRRRSSQLPIPALTTIGHESSVAKNRPRRVPVAQTPVKRAKRSSLLGGARQSSSIRMSLLRGSVSCADPNGSGDLSFKAPNRPTWR